MTRYIVEMVHALLILSLLYAQELVETQVIFSHDKFNPGKEYKLAVEFDIKRPYHLYGPSQQDQLTRTQVRVKSDKVFAFGDVIYPAVIKKNLDFGEGPKQYELYEDKIHIIIPFKVAEDAATGSYDVTILLNYQVCSDTECMIPVQNQPLTAKLTVSTEVPLEINKEIFGRVTTYVDQTDDLSSRPFLSVLLIMFVAGLGASLTPCVYPMIPVTITFFMLQAAKKRLQAFILAVFYVLGIALIYSILGAIAGAAGGGMGQYLGYPVVLVTVSVIFALLGLSMFGLYEFRLPYFLTGAIGGGKRGILGSFVMGATLAVVAAPCVGPLLLSVLTYIATYKDVVKGALYLFTFALGMGVLFIILAVFAVSLPKSGSWLIVVKNIFGIIMFAMAVYYIQGLLDLVTAVVLVSILFLIYSIFVGFRHKLIIPALVTLLLSNLLLAGLAFNYGKYTLSEYIVGSVIGRVSKLDWIKDEKIGLEIARKQSKPVVVDFYAEWCLPCKGIMKIFEEPEVAKELSRFVIIKVDVTNTTGENYRRMVEFYKFPNPPAIAFYDSSGELLTNLSIKHYNITAEDLIRILQGIQ